MRNHARSPDHFDVSSRIAMRIGRRMSTRSLWEIQGGLCWYCKRPVPSRRATVDHVVAQCHGGENSNQNSVMACARCNVAKGHKKTHRTKTLARINALRELARLEPVTVEDAGL